jgi:beta-glucosidase
MKCIFSQSNFESEIDCDIIYFNSSSIAIVRKRKSLNLRDNQKLTQRMNPLFKGLLCLFIASWLVSCIPQQETKKSISIRERRTLERSNDTSIEKKIDDLISQMTLEEKVGQMMQINNSEIVTDAQWGAGADLSIEIKVDTAKLATMLRNYHVGSFLNGIAVPAQTWFQFYKDLQDVNMRVSRLKIPIIYGIDHMHGPNYVEGATVFPHAINTAATYNNQFPADMAYVTAIETADLGHQWLFAPVLDLARTPLWGRYYETLGESPYVVSTMGKIFVETVQQEEAIAPYKIAATAKHFFAYSDPKYGWDRGPVDLSTQTLYEYHLPAFKAAFDAGIKTVMINSGEINGEPVHASHWILTEILRDELNFKGVAVTDWEDIIRLYRNHHVATDEREATYLAIQAGIDVAMTPYTTDFFDHLIALVKEGKISEERINLSVSRILRLKFETNLFDHPYPRNDRFDRIGAKENKAKALAAAQESLVLLKNESVLPLKSSSKILLAGPNANIKRALSGGWTLRWIPAEEEIFPKEMHTVYSALQQQFSAVTLAQNNSEIKSKAAQADVIVLALGELPYSEGFGSIVDINLPEEQAELFNIAKSTGKPIVLLMISGRPRIITKQFADSKAVIFAGLPGFEGAQAIADVISGVVNPSGKLSFNYPYAANRLVPHNHKISEVQLAHEIDNPICLLPFGFGLSYTTFEYSNLTLSADALTRTGELTASVSVKNTGTIPGKEAVLWFIHDDVGSLSRPIKELKFYEKELIAPGETKTFKFTIKAEQLGFPDKNGVERIENGFFTLLVGNQKIRFELK